MIQSVDNEIIARAVVHIVDDDPVIRDSLCWLFASCGLKSRDWPSGEAFLAALPIEEIACIVLDVRMEGIGGAEVFDRLKAAGSTAPVIFLTGHAEVPIAVEALKHGAADFVEKPFNDNKLVDLVIAELHRFAALRKSRHKQAEIEGRLALLSVRELDVLPLLLAGRMNKQIANDLDVAVRTIEVHRASILYKMGARNAVELATLLSVR